MNIKTLCATVLLMVTSQVSYAIQYINFTDVKVDLVRNQFLEFNSQDGDGNPVIFNGYISSITSSQLTDECNGYAHIFFGETENFPVISNLASFDLYKIYLNTLNMALATDLLVDLNVKITDDDSPACSITSISVKARAES